MFNIHLHSHPEYISDYIKENRYWEKIQTEILREIFKQVI